MLVMETLSRDYGCRPELSSFTPARLRAENDTGSRPKAPSDRRRRIERSSTTDAMPRIGLAQRTSKQPPVRLRCRGYRLQVDPPATCLRYNQVNQVYEVALLG